MKRAITLTSQVVILSIKYVGVSSKRFNDYDHLNIKKKKR
tara:strand:- start:175 stop:294 length:120 start_codon:yes stop_codon:yes gene_type:complete